MEIPVQVGICKGRRWSFRHRHGWHEAASVFAHCSDGSDEIGRANARLIAAAPELLAGCRTALEVAESWIHDQLDGTSSLDGALAELAPVRAALAKATGGQS
jgi:hypothetical protein